MLRRRLWFRGELSARQFALAMKLYNTLGDMTFTVDRINALRAALDDRAGKLSADATLAVAEQSVWHGGPQASKVMLPRVR